MKKVLFTLLLAILAVCIFISCGGGGTTVDTSVETDADTSADTDSGVSGEDIVIHSISDFNLDSEVDSHNGQTQYSHLEMSNREYKFIDASFAGTKSLYYPRIKQMADGNYILFYMDGDVGPNIYYMTSSNLKKWSAPKRLFSHSSGSDMYACADAVVLENGDILVAASFRLHYSGDSKSNGLVLRRSSDNGKTWTDIEKIYTGATWEPSFLVLPSGEIQIYWTNTHVKGASVANGGRVDDNSTGTAMIRSFDNGKTWSCDVNTPYSGQIVMQEYTKTGSDGRYYSGQMPVATVLNNGKIALALEVRTLDSSGNKTYHLSMAYTDVENSWPVSLGADEEGPSTLRKKIYAKSAGPYIRQFKSGETLLTFHWDGWYSRIGNTSATSFNDRVHPFGDKETHQWGSTEIVGTHKVLGTVTSADKMLIHLGSFYLNHTIKAESISPVIDGYSEDWNDIDQAFFVGSETQAQLSLRTAQDDDYVYFMAEVLDYYLSDKDKVGFIVGNGATGEYHNVSVSATGELTISTNGKGISLSKADVEYKVISSGTIDVWNDSDQGYVIEIKIPKSAFGSSVSTLIINPTLYNKDKSTEKAKSDTVAELSLTNVQNWLRINLK